jgi:hypothetical protein
MRYGKYGLLGRMKAEFSVMKRGISAQRRPLLLEQVTRADVPGHET